MFDKLLNTICDIKLMHNFKFESNIAEGRKFIIECITNNIFNVDATLLHIAASSGDAELLKELNFANGANVRDAKGNIPIHYAVLHGNIDTVKVLLEKGASPTLNNKDGYCALFIAIALNNLGALHAMSKYIEDDDNKPCVYRLRFQMSYTDIKDANGFSAFHYAAACNDLAILDALHYFKFNPMLTDKFGNTPLHLAASLDNNTAVSMLSKISTSVNPVNDNGDTPLHLAKSSECAKILIEHGACVDEPNKQNGNTPLHNALIAGYSDVIKTLVDNHAASDVPNKNGLTVNAMSTIIHGGKFAELFK